MTASRDDGGSAAALGAGWVWGGEQTNEPRHKPRSLAAVDVVVVVISSTYRMHRMRILAYRRDLPEAADSPPRALVAPRAAPSAHVAMKRVVGCALLLGTTSDALSLTTAVRHRHVCSSSSVAMGLFDGLKKVCRLPPTAASSDRAYPSPVAPAQLAPPPQSGLRRRRDQALRFGRAHPGQGPRPGAAAAVDAEAEESATLEFAIAVVTAAMGKVAAGRASSTHSPSRSSQ